MDNYSTELETKIREKETKNRTVPQTINSSSKESVKHNDSCTDGIQYSCLKSYILQEKHLNTLQPNNNNNNNRICKYSNYSNE